MSSQNPLEGENVALLGDLGHPKRILKQKLQQLGAGSTYVVSAKTSLVIVPAEKNSDGTFSTDYFDKHVKRAQQANIPFVSLEYITRLESASATMVTKEDFCVSIDSTNSTGRRTSSRQKNIGIKEEISQQEESCLELSSIRTRKRVYQHAANEQVTVDCVNEVEKSSKPVKGGRQEKRTSDKPQAKKPKVEVAEQLSESCTGDISKDVTQAAKTRITTGVKTEIDTAARERSKQHDDLHADDEKGVVMKTEIRKGAAVVDPHCPSAADKTVFHDANSIYDALLNQTNISTNNNKFYVLQIVTNDSNGCFYFFTRWGRVGEAGQKDLKGPLGKEAAIALFKKKFLDKTKNNWDDRANFVKVAGKYDILERDYGAETNEECAEEKKPKFGKIKKKSVIVSRLDDRVQKLVRLICSLDMMKAQMVELGYDAKRLPLGKLTKRHIQRGFTMLQKLSVLINRMYDKEEGAATATIEVSPGDTLESLSSAFYTLIPHDFGRNKPPIIRTKQMLKDKLMMVESLADIEIATKLMKEGEEQEEIHPLDAHYRMLHCNIMPVDHDSDEFHMIESYAKHTHGHTHTGYTLKIEDIFKLDRENENDHYKQFAETPNRQLLWHGSRLTNYVGILSQGLRIAPPEAPVTGYMFGKGLYFADMVSKSANYCWASKGQSTGLILLCEVALGDMNEKVKADYHAAKLPKGKLSTKGLGITRPRESESVFLPDGVKVPLGRPETVPNSGSVLQYNEYIVYNTAQVRMRYLLRAKFEFL